MAVDEERKSVFARSFTLTIEEIQFLEKRGNDPEYASTSKYLRNIIDKEIKQYDDDLSRIFKELRKLREREKYIYERIKSAHIKANITKKEYLSLADEVQNIGDILRSAKPLLDNLGEILKIK